MARFADLGEFGPTLDAAAERLGISPTAVEKDYWVSQVLRVLGRDFDGDFIFKGGTSLSKGYRLVERFSEDIDVLVLPGERSRGATDRLMKAMAEAAATGVGGSATGVGGSETGRHRSYEIAYAATREPTALIRTSVLLEMGVRGGPHPHTPVPISSLLGDVLEAAGTDLGEFDDLAAVRGRRPSPGTHPPRKARPHPRPVPASSPRTPTGRSTGVAAGTSTTSTSSWATARCSTSSPTETRPTR